MKQNPGTISLIGRSFICSECGQKHKVDMLHIEQGDTDRICLFFKKVFGANKKILLLADDITWEVAGERCKESLEKEYKVFPVVLIPRNEKRVTAKEGYLPEIEKKALNTEIILTVGTGTITDLGKIIGSNRYKPVVCFPTAPSMNGYTSPVAAYIKEGLKLTIPISPAHGVFSDMNILEKSPLELIKSGFADSMAKAFANADWKISSLITGESFCPLPYRMVSEAGPSEKDFMDEGELLIRRDHRAIGSLMQTLNMGGISMILAGKSSPASGGEHMISHFLDMYAHQYRGEVFAYHGIQVGTGIFISSLIYEAMRGLTSSEIKQMIARTKIDYQKYLERLLSLFPAGAELIKREFDEKMAQIAVLREKLPGEWKNIREGAFGMVQRPERIAGIFKRAEIPVHLREIAVGEKMIYDVITLSRFIRGRVTILDIAGEAGMLEEQLVREYLETKP